MKWLVEHNADINSVDRRGETPFMWACRSHINRLAKVRYLCEKGADCQAKDHEGKTALFHAKCEDDEVKDVLRYLVIEKGIDINSVDKEGTTPLLDACYYNSSFLAIQQLIELGADLSVRNKRKQNALHKVAKSYQSVDASVIDLLIKKGDVTCQDQYGLTPYEDAARFSVLQRETVRPDSIKFCVVGSKMAGKTTYVNSLLQLNQPLPKNEDRTPGVEIHNCQIPGVGKGSAWDFGAQPTFHSAHERRKDDVRNDSSSSRKGRFWCAFSKAALRTLPPHLKSRIRLLDLIGFNEEAGVEVRFELKRIAEILQNEFGDTFEISGVLEMDCSKRQSDRMNDCRKKLKYIREKMLETADDVPKLCHAIEQYLSLPNEKRKNPLAYFLTADEFEKWVAEKVGIKLAEDEKKVAVEYLDSSGIIINLGRRICLQPIWLCHSVIGPLLAPPYFVVAMPATKFGRASKKRYPIGSDEFRKLSQAKGQPVSICGDSRRSN
ncbi:death-associated protein kinase 1-like [Oscarella lobularis]|uniref:death-associated protein kinase 1-like n=1 Tax=Oscarella lobularis TaxID=121494 RepID=UPI0033134D67